MAALPGMILSVFRQRSSGDGDIQSRVTEKLEDFAERNWEIIRCLILDGKSPCPGHNCNR